MHRSKQILGVTLLEIMLVLAIAAMIITMSIRYYKAATAEEQSNAILSQIQAIIATADNLALAKNNYQGVVSNSSLAAVLGSKNMKTPTNGYITLTLVTPTGFNIAIELTPNVCADVVAKLKTNLQFSNFYCTLQTLTFTYSKNAMPSS